MKFETKVLQLKDGSQAVLRSPSSSDARLLLDHILRLTSNEYKNLNYSAEYYRDFTVEKEQQIIEGFLESKDRFMISAFLGEKVVGNIGFASLGMGFQKTSARFGMGIEKPYQGLGIGKALLEEALAFGKELGFHRVELTVRAYNFKAIQMYEKFEFQKVGLLKEVSFIDDQFVDEYMYQRIL